MAALGVVLSLVAVFSPNMLGLIAVVGISLPLSLMLPTIYGVALQGLGPGGGPRAVRSQLNSACWTPRDRGRALTG